MHIVEPDLAALHARVAAAQVDPPGSNRLDLAALQRQPGLVAFVDKVVVARLAVVGYGLVGLPIVAWHWSILKQQDLCGGVSIAVFACPSSGSGSWAAR